MNSNDVSSPSTAGNSIFLSHLNTAFRGGIIMLFGSLLWGFFSWTERGVQFGFASNYVFGWLPSAWLVFAIGSVLGYFLPRLTVGRNPVFVVMVGLLLGVVVGGVISFGVLFCRYSHDVLGLFVNKGGNGYASYSFSVWHKLYENGWRLLVSTGGLTVVWVLGWTLWDNRHFKSVPLSQIVPETIQLRCDRCLFWVLGKVAIGFATITTAIYLFHFIFQKESNFLASFVVGLSAVVLMVLGPWFGPLIVNSGAGHHLAWQLSAVGIPVLVAGFAPFIFKLRVKNPFTAVLLWSGLLSAVLFWVAIGVYSLGNCMG